MHSGTAIHLSMKCKWRKKSFDLHCFKLTAIFIFWLSSEEVQIQKLVAQMTGWKMAINSAVPCLVILFFGSWSDRHNRRKPCILVPLFGQIMMAFALLLCVYFENSPIEMAIFVEVFFPSITGSPISLCMRLVQCIAKFSFVFLHFHILQVVISLWWSVFTVTSPT